MLTFDKANKGKRVKQNILEHTEQKLLATNQQLLQSANVTNVFWKSNTAEMLGHSDFHWNERCGAHRMTQLVPLSTGEGRRCNPQMEDVYADLSSGCNTTCWDNTSSLGAAAVLR